MMVYFFILLHPSYFSQIIVDSKI